ncbi:MAG: protein translocase subunit SecD [Chlamydiales bacterium]|nr:protein translocase subunit SecD [Chlamydiales bacterium]
MEKQRQWQRFLIVAVLILTVYNILPTLFYYSKPLHKSIDAKRAEQISLSIAERVNSLEKDSVEWLNSYCALLNLKPQTIILDEKQPQLVSITFKNAQDAQKFRRFFPRAGSLISFVPAQLSLSPTLEGEEGRKTVFIHRKIPVHFSPQQLSSFFQFSAKADAQGRPTPLYHALVNDRLLEVALSLGGTSQNAQFVQGSLGNLKDPQVQDLILFLAQDILSFTKSFGEDSPIASRYFATFTQTEGGNAHQTIQSFIAAVEQLKDQVKLDRIAIQNEKEQKKVEGSYLDGVKQQRLDQLTSREKILSSALAIIKKKSSLFAAGKTPWNYTTLGAAIDESEKKSTGSSKIQTISLEGRSPFIEKLSIDWSNEKIILHPFPDILTLKADLQKKGDRRADGIEQFIYNEIALASREASEKITPLQDQFEISLNQLTGSSSFVALRLGSIAQAEAVQLKQLIQKSWAPKHPDLKREEFPIWDYDTYLSLPAEQKKLGLLIYSPAQYNKMPAKGFRMNSIYILARGVDKIMQKAEAAPESEEARQFMEDFHQLREILQSSGFFGYAGSARLVGSEYAQDFIFEKENYYQTLLKATREDFTVHGTKRFASLEFTDVEQRILTENKIGTRIHEDLQKWSDDYNAARLGIKGISPYDVPKPTKSILWSNLDLSFSKYFRGDDRKILHWGLDLSGGKTVQIELRDAGGRIVTNEVDIKQGINELYKRVNKMGVSEVSIRQEGNTITLDFPGSQGLSAQELVKASSMYFHIVNEKFSSSNSQLSEEVGRFLQEVWNEAVVTNRKDAEEINQIAWQHLHGDSVDPDVVQPRSEAAKILYENGLRLTSPQDPSASSMYNDTYSKIAVMRGEDFTEWHGQTNPLMITFRNYALEGSNLENVHSSYDPSKGNFLSFGVKGSQVTKEVHKFSPRDALFAWTSRFSKEKVIGTPLDVYSRGRGWRMAVILNGTIISAPTLDSALRDSAMITGSFTQREVSQLEADLKAGSLSFTPRILSEKNVSPEIGAQERTLGIWAMFISLLFVIGAMVGYYRFGGVVASVAVIFNLLIMWATLQNLSATLTLATIAGLVLTLAMAVDANVLVFERIREEFAVTGRIAHAVHAGYKRAFSAILDSNVTTIIAALILMHFDSGPIKGFAITLIIGIVSSMFTALFMTRFFFNGWVQNSKNKALNMASWIKSSNFNFLKFTKPTLIVSTLIIAVGALVFTTQRHTILGMDFTGGYAIEVELPKQTSSDYRKLVETALIKAGAPQQDFQVRELTPSNNVRIFLSQSMDHAGHAFFGLESQDANRELTYPYEANPKIIWVVDALQKAGLTLSEKSLQGLDKSWSAVSGQMSEAMQTSALMGLGLALICILVYVTVRFEFKYAISATICLAHDVLITIGMLAILHALGVAVQIDLNTIAALMTIIGYSLNDTIIIFDRIREDLKQMRKFSFKEIINHALNATLSRTTLTSGITLVALIPLVALGGSTIFGFALVMSMGVIFGTLSSLFIAAPLLQYFHQRDEKKTVEVMRGDI